MRSVPRLVTVFILAACAAACGDDAAPEPSPKQAVPVPAIPEPVASPPATEESAPIASEVAAPVEAVVPSAEPAAEPAQRALAIVNKPWTGDFQEMLQRKRIRVLVPYGRTLFFNDKGTERGITVDNVRDFERYLNKKYVRDKRPVTVVILPTTRDKLLPQVAAGLGDIAAGNLTVTEARLKTVDFVAPDEARPVRELVVTGPKAPPLKSLDDLSGRTVAVRPTTSQHESIEALNRRFVAAKKPPIDIKQLPVALENEDILEMTNAGLLDIVVVDDWMAEMWAQVLPNIEVHEDLSVRDGGRTGWAIRKGSPQLHEAILDFYRQHLVKQGVVAYRLAQYMKRIEQIQDPTQAAGWKRFEETIALFREYGDRYGFDPLMLAAQGFQESRLDQNAKSHVGAIGVMQIMPATGKELGVGDIRQIEANIHAGTKYVDQLMTRYFKDAKFDPQNRALFAFAAYNAGPGRIQQMRKLAAERGLNPDLWFNNVEIVTAERVGIETTTYVRNIFKYYVSYKLLLEQEAARKKAIEQVAPGTTS